MTGMRFKYCIVLFLISMGVFAQKGYKVDGIAAVIGDEIVLDSDIAQMMFYSRSSGEDVNDKCQFIDNIMLEKFILQQAKQDTLISINDEEITRRVDAYINQYISQLGSIERVLEEMNMQTRFELETEIKEYVENTSYVQQKQQRITDGVDVSPQELREFYDRVKNDLPTINEEIELAHIVMYPKLTEDHKNQLTGELQDLKQRVKNGEDFGSLAQIYSKDPGSAKNGGFIKNVKRGQMVKEFEAVAFNLEEGEISDPLETEYGFHIIKLEKRKGQELDLRHILILSTPNTEEIRMAEKKLDSIRKDILDGKLTFKEAVMKYTDDKYSRYNSGIITNQNTGESRIEKISLSSKSYIQVSGLKPGDISDVFEDKWQDREAVRLIQVKSIIPSHKYSLDTDYNRLKQFALKEKQQNELIKWVKSRIDDTFIKIDSEYKNCPFTLDWLKEGDIAYSK